MYPSIKAVIASNKPMTVDVGTMTTIPTMNSIGTMVDFEQNPTEVYT